MIYICAIIVSILFILFIINLVKKDKIDEKYSILWLFFAIIIIVLAAWPNIVGSIAKAFDVYYPPSLMFAFGFVILGAYIVHLSMVVTRQNKMLVKLTQEVAMIKEEKQKEK